MSDMSQYFFSFLFNAMFLFLKKLERRSRRTTCIYLKERRNCEVLLLKEQKKVRKRDGQGRRKEKVKESPTSPNAPNSTTHPNKPHITSKFKTQMKTWNRCWKHKSWLGRSPISIYELNHLFHHSNSTCLCLNLHILTSFIGIGMHVVVLNLLVM